jgi:hypothetical protein
LSKEVMKLALAALDGGHVDRAYGYIQEALAQPTEERDAELRVCVKEFFEKYLNRTEESDSGKMFNPIVVSCCRAMMTEPLSNLLDRMAELSGAERRTHD